MTTPATRTLRDELDHYLSRNGDMTQYLGILMELGCMPDFRVRLAAVVDRAYPGAGSGDSLLLALRLLAEETRRIARLRHAPDSEPYRRTDLLDAIAGVPHHMVTVAHAVGLIPGDPVENNSPLIGQVNVEYIVAFGRRVDAAATEMNCNRYGVDWAARPVSTTAI